MAIAPETKSAPVFSVPLPSKLERSQTYSCSSISAPLLTAPSMQRGYSAPARQQKDAMAEISAASDAVFTIELVRGLSRSVSGPGKGPTLTRLVRGFGAIVQTASECSDEPLPRSVPPPKRIGTYVEEEVDFVKKDAPYSENLICLGVLSLIIGNAMLTMPYGLVLTGWLGIPVFVACMALLLYTSLLLGQVLSELQNQQILEPQYGDIGVKAFGSFARRPLECFVILECAFLGVFTLVFVSTTLAQLLPLSQEVLTFTTAFIGLLFLLVPKQYCHLLKVAGIVFTLGCMGAAMFSGFWLVGFEDDMTKTSLTGTKGFDGLPATAALVAFTTADHPYFVGLYVKAGSLQTYRNGMIKAHAIFAALSCVACAVCYATYGTRVDKIVLTDIGRDYQGSLSIPILPAICSPALAIRGIVVLPDFVQPVVNHVLKLFKDATGVDVDESSDAYSRQYFIRMSLAVLVFGLCAICADCLSELLIELETLTACVFKTINAFLVPCLGTLVICRQSLSNSHKLCLCLALVVGVLWGIIGITSSLRKMISGH